MAGDILNLSVLPWPKGIDGDDKPLDEMTVAEMRGLLQWTFFALDRQATAVLRERDAAPVGFCETCDPFLEVHLEMALAPA